MLDAVGLRFQAVLGVMLNSGEWTAGFPPRRPTAVGKVKISWYGLTESHLVVLRCKDGRRIALLLLPPDTLETVALTAILMASTPGNHLSADDTLARAADRVSSPLP